MSIGTAYVASTDHEKAQTSMTQQPPVREPLLELYDALAQHQLRDAGAEVAAAIAHAVGTPLNVISGRAELIRHDPSNALAQVARIEEQVKKLASGLRQLVDYLAQPDPLAALRPTAGGKRTPADAASASAAVAPVPAAGGDAVIVDARTVLEDLSRLSAPLARANGAELVVDGKALDGVRIERWHALGTLSSLVSGALRHAGRKGDSGGSSAPPRVLVSATSAEQGVSFELSVPGLAMLEGWQLEHFQARPAPADVPEFFRTVSICAAVVRGHGGRLFAESGPDGASVVVRFSCRNEPGAA